MSSRVSKDAVLAALEGRSSFNSDALRTQLDFWFDNAGLPDLYFQICSPETVAAHILNYMASKIVADTSGRGFSVQVKQEDTDTALFITRSFVVGETDNVRHETLGNEHSPVLSVEHYIEQRYLCGTSIQPGDVSPTFSSHDAHTFDSPGKVVPDGRVFRLQALRSRSAVDDVTGVHLRLYFLQAPRFKNPNPLPKEKRLEQLGDERFLETTSAELLSHYQDAMTEAVDTDAPVVRIVPRIMEADGKPSALVLIAHKIGETHSFFAGFPNVYRYYHCFSTTKYVEPFSNNIIIFAFVIRSLTRVHSSGVEQPRVTSDMSSRLSHIAEDASLHFVLPRHSLTPLLGSYTLSAQQVAYAYCAWKFTFHFLNRGQQEQTQLASLLKKVGADGYQVLSRLRQATQLHGYNEGVIMDVIFRNPELVEWLYEDFAKRHMPTKMHRRSRIFSVQVEAFGGVLSPQDEIQAGLQYLKRACRTELDFAVFSTFFEFNTHILKTNFYKPGKTALAFRLDPAFLDSTIYPEKPFGVFMLVGAEFRGFHIRFRDVARGGVRLVQSRYPQAYNQNVINLFDECYNLASTQQRKNKDIPEGGSKGVILLGLDHQSKGEVAFRKYVDSLLDLLLPEKRAMVDHYGDQEFIFLGPDEGTAEFMDWASLHVRSRGYTYWKAFTTGKSVSQGGIPHDMYGMTTRSVRGYVTGIQAKCGIDGPTTTKMQTGGPDGDLGSNEIKLGNERTVAIVDGSGVLVDPAGIDLQELRRLANLRKPISLFDTSKLSPKGYRVLVEDKDVKLPDGTVVESGLDFRNTFHLQSNRISSVFFVPCGGRPAAVSADNWQEFLYDEQRRPRFQYIVEGANLFFTQDARLKLEDAGVVVVKDASANKGGVTSSSLEVLAAMALSDEEFDDMMTVKGATPPKFYSTYVAEVQSIIEKNAKLEFEFLWRHKEKKGGYMSVTSDNLSSKIVTLRDAISASDVLWSNTALRNKVLTCAVPKTLQTVVSVEMLQDRLPDTYLRALFASYLASRFVYSNDLDTSDFAFFEYIQRWIEAKDVSQF